jgi:uncharacterized protein (DUF2147 family)
MRFANFIAVFALISPQAAFAAAGSVEGLWLTENKRSVIEVKQCGELMCGAVHWIIEGGMQFDEKNPDETKRFTPMCGLQIMYGLKNDDDAGIERDEWEDGKIYKADDGEMYDADIALQDDGSLKVQGYMGVSFLGKTQTWTRVNEADYPKCTPASK